MRLVWRLPATVDRTIHVGDDTFQVTLRVPSGAEQIADKALQATQDYLALWRSRLKFLVGWSGLVDEESGSPIPFTPDNCEALLAHAEIGESVMTELLFLLHRQLPESRKKNSEKPLAALPPTDISPTSSSPAP